MKQSLCIRQTSYSYVRLNLRATMECAAKLRPPCILAIVLRWHPCLVHRDLSYSSRDEWVSTLGTRLRHQVLVQKLVERLLVCHSACWLLVIVHYTNLFCIKQFSGSTQQVTAPIFRHLPTSLSGWVFIACTTSITSVNLKWKHHKLSL